MAWQERLKVMHMGRGQQLCIIIVYTLSTSLTMLDIGMTDLDPLLQRDFTPVLNTLRNCNVSIGSLVITLLTQWCFKKSIHLHDLLLHSLAHIGISISMTMLMSQSLKSLSCRSFLNPPPGHISSSRFMTMTLYRKEAIS